MRDAIEGADPTNLFAGDSDLTTLLRSHDWSQTPLGAIETWSSSLKTTVRILLTELDRAKQLEQAPLELEADQPQDCRSAAAFQVRLTNALRPLTDANEIQEIAARILGESLGASRVIYIEVLPGDQEVIIHKNYANGVAELNGLYRLEDFGRNLTADHRAGRTAIVPDVANYPQYIASQKASYRSIEIAAHIDVPLIKNERFVALLAVHQATPRQWTADEVKRVEETAEQTWAAVERARAEASLRQSEERYRILFESIDEGFCVVEVLLNDQDTPIDYRILEINPAFEQQTGLQQAVGQTARQLNLEEHWIETYGQVALTGESVRFENGSKTLNRWFDVYACRTGEPEVRKVAIVLKDISDRKRAEESLRQAAAFSAFCVSLADALRPLADPIEIQAVASRMLGEYLGVNRVAYFEVNSAAYVVQQNYVNGATPLAGSYPIDSFGPKLLAAYRTGRTVSTSDVQIDSNLSPAQRSAYAAIQIGAYIDIPLVKRGEFVAVLAVHSAKLRTWTPDEVSLVEEVAERIWAAVDRAHAEADLRQGEARFRRIFDCEMVPMGIYTKVGGIIAANNSLLNLIGYTRQELEAGQINWQALTPPEYRSLDEKALSEIEVRGVSTPYEKVYLHKDGRRIPILIGAALFLEDASSGILFAIDLSERKAAEAALQEQSQLMQLILASIGDGLILANPQGEFLLFNRAAESIFGRLTNEKPCEEWSRTYGLFLPDQQTLFPDQQLPLYRAMQGESATDVEVFVRRNPTAEGRWVSISGFPVRDQHGDITGGVITCRDISERKRISQQEQAAREEAERANRIKDEFLAVLSHELRSPLNPILGWSKLLQQGKLDAAKTTTALTTIERNAQLQVQLIDDLLDISRILQGKLSLTVLPVDLSTVISEALETVRLAAEAKTIQIDTTLSPGVGTVMGDAGRLQQVAWNLLSNAVKFTPPGGHVTVALAANEHHAQIQVSDTGKGIKPDFLPYVFEHFRQEDGATTRKFGGLGLGLAIVRQIVELHGGTVAVESLGEGAGATFTVQIPLAARFSVLPEIEPSPNATENLSGLRILVVDDETDSREFVAFVLEQAGAIVTAVASGVEALQAFSQALPNILVSDVGMPEMDGYILIRQIRSLPLEQGGQIPAIALTAYAGELDQQQAISAGFQRHLAKPIDPETVIAIITELVSSA